MVLGLSPLLYFSRRISLPIALIAAYLCFVTEILVACRWIYEGAAGVMGPQYYGVAILAAVVKAVPYVFAAGILNVVSRRAGAAWPLLAGTVFALAEVVVSNGDHALAFAGPSLSASHSVAAQLLVPYFGAPFLTFVLVAGTARCCETIFSERPWNLSFAIASLSVALCCVPWRQAELQMPGRMVTVLFKSDYVAAKAASEVMSRRDDVLIVMPEDAMVYHSRSEMSVDFAALRRIATARRATVVAGLSGFDGAALRNQAAIITPGGAISLYTKQRLIPFAEYVPYRPLFEHIFPIVRELSDFQRGDSFLEQRLDPANVLLRPLLCYEGVLSSSFRSLPADSVVVELTDDSWFKSSFGALQQLDALEMRALENGVPIIVASRTGPSGVIDRFGSFEGANDGLATLSIHPRRRTLYARFGDTAAFLAIGCTMICCYIALLYPYRRGAGRTSPHVAVAHARVQDAAGP
jgi:apolipoprotein N-acyltransferase